MRLKTGIGYFSLFTLHSLSFQPPILLHGIEGHEGKEDGRGGFVGLIGEVGTVVVILAEFYAAGTTEHDVDDGHITREGEEPMPPEGVCAETADEHPRPEEHLAKVVGATHEAIEARADETMGVALLGYAFLMVGHGFKKEASGGNTHAYPQSDIIPHSTLQAYGEGRHLAHIEQGATHPDEEMGRHGIVGIGLGVEAHGMAIGGTLQFAPQQVTCQTAAIDDGKTREEGGAKRERAPVHHAQGHTYGRNAGAVTHGDKPQKAVPSDGVNKEGDE